MWRLPLGSPGSPSLSCRARLFTGWLEPLHRLKQADEGKRRLEMLLASGALRVLIRPMLLWTHAHDRASIVQVRHSSMLLVRLNVYANLSVAEYSCLHEFYLA